jgi:type VI protein secretion system component Hcp
MKTLFFLVLILPIVAFAQKQDVFIKLTDAKGTSINGDVSMRGFEKNIQALSIATAGKNNSLLNFTMEITGASAELKKAMANGELLMNGQVTVTQSGRNSMPSTVYIIKMEEIKVRSCSESMGCNSAMTTSVTLQANRIGWTYYQTSRTGIQTVSNKYGYDNETGGSWDNF